MKTIDLNATKILSLDLEHKTRRNKKEKMNEKKKNEK